MDHVAYGSQRIEEDDISAVVTALRSDLITGGTSVARFEAAFAEETNAADAVACASGTAGLHLAMLALGIGPDDVVIVPGMTFSASANCVRFVGGHVHFADVDPDTGLMTVETLRAALAGARSVFPDKKLAAVVAVHLNGQTEDVAGLSDLAREAGAILVIDACHALGTRWGPQRIPVGAAAHAACEVFSFHPVKTIAMGEGGAVTTRDPALAERIRLLRGHGISRDRSGFVDADEAFDASGAPHAWYYEMQALGYNYRVSDINCALGLSQLSKLDRFRAHRQEIAAAYRSALAGLAPHIHAVRETPDCIPCWHLMSVLIDFPKLETTRGEVMDALRRRGLGTQVHYIPVFRQPYWQDYLRRVGQAAEAACPGSVRYYERQLSLPLHMDVTPAHVQTAAEVLGDLVTA